MEQVATGELGADGKSRERAFPDGHVVGGDLDHLVHRLLRLFDHQGGQQLRDRSDGHRDVSVTRIQNGRVGLVEDERGARTQSGLVQRKRSAMHMRVGTVDGARGVVVVPAADAA